MDSFSDSTTIARVTRVVFNHGFADSFEWLEGLDELATLTDEEIEAIASEDTTDGDDFDTDPNQGELPLLLLSDAPDGLSYEEQYLFITNRLAGLSRHQALAEAVD